MTPTCWLPGSIGTADAGAAAAKEVDGLFVHTDVTAENDVEALFAAAVDTYGRVDVA